MGVDIGGGEEVGEEEEKEEEVCSKRKSRNWRSDYISIPRY